MTERMLEHQIGASVQQSVSSLGSGTCVLQQDTWLLLLLSTQE